jgi:hypothetical protein
VQCPACRKKVVFGSIRGAAWEKVNAGDWLLGGRSPKPGVLGDCPACGVRLEWEPGEEREAALSNVPARVHLSALRESPQAWRGRVALRALVVEIHDVLIASDSWRNRPRGGAAEDDRAMLERLLREQVPRIAVTWTTPESAERFREAGRALDGGSRAAWVEMEGSFEPGEGGGVVSVAAVTSVWPPRD